MYLFGFELITEIMMQKVAGGGKSELYLLSFLIKWKNQEKKKREVFKE